VEPLRPLIGVEPPPPIHAQSIIITAYWVLPETPAELIQPIAQILLNLALLKTQMLAFGLQLLLLAMLTTALVHSQPARLQQLLAALLQLPPLALPTMIVAFSRLVVLALLAAQAPMDTSLLSAHLS